MPVVKCLFNPIKNAFEWKARCTLKGEEVNVERLGHYMCLMQVVVNKQEGLTNLMAWRGNRAKGPVSQVYYCAPHPTLVSRCFSLLTDRVQTARKPLELLENNLRWTVSRAVSLQFSSAVCVRSEEAVERERERKTNCWRCVQNVRWCLGQAKQPTTLGHSWLWHWGPLETPLTEPPQTSSVLTCHTTGPITLNAVFAGFSYSPLYHSQRWCFSQLEGLGPLICPLLLSQLEGLEGPPICLLRFLLWRERKTWLRGSRWSSDSS